MKWQFCFYDLRLKVYDLFFSVTLIQQGILRWKISILIFTTDSLITLLQRKES